MKQYNYLVSYFCKGGFGSIIVLRSRKIKSIESVEKLNAYIESTQHLENVGVMSYQLVNVERVKKGRKQSCAC